ncbi:ATP-binding protein [Flavobacterium sp.]|uniref:ATP-binding protein n=1 Tax=Flavobacterium sp. TaxID=239 RepID=UPI002610B1A3|nr:ATP-binding protein [Flavobacterium sp.]MDD2986581.1 histidine kinase [Flavobacterium sp.]
MSKKISFYFFLFFCVVAFSQTKTDSIDYYVKQNELIKALDYGRAQSKYYFENKQFDNYCKISIKKAVVFGRLNDHDKSLSTLFNALNISNTHKLKGSAEIIEQIATRYSMIRDTSKAFNNYYKALKIGETEKDTATLVNIYQNLFRLYSQRNSDSAYVYMSKKFDLDKRTKSVKGISISYNNHFAYYTIIGKPELAKTYLDSCFNFAQKYKLNQQIISALFNLGYHETESNNDFKKALEIYNKIKKDFQKDMTTTDHIDLYSSLVYVYENLDDYERANYYNTLLHEYNNKMYNEQLSDKVREIETNYEIKKVENEYQEKSKLLHETQNRNKKIIFVFVALFGFSLVLFYFFYQNLQLKQRNKIKEIDSEIQENIINASLDAQEFERKKLAEVLHDSISALLSSASLHLSAYLVGNKTEIPQEILKARSLLKEAHDQVRDLSHELVPPVLAKLGLFYALQDLCEKNSNSVIDFTFNHYGSFRQRFNEEFEIKVYFIITELVNNILKHSNASLGNINVEERNGHLIINIEDNGKGFDDTKSLNTDGYGLTQIKARVRSLKGKISIISKINKGTLIYIKLHIPPR